MSEESDEQLVLRVIRCANDHYKVLHVQRGATAEEIKAMYKKHALRLHPDKCRHPQAEEAFKHVGRAYATLSDPAKRSVYDRHGEEGVQAHESGGHPGGGRHGPRRHQRDDADVLFQMFEEMFGMPRHHFQHQQQQQQPRPPAAHAQQVVLTQFVPVLMIILVYLLSNGSLLNEATPGFSLTPQSTYTQARTTKTLGGIKVQYYVEASFGRKYGSDGYTLRAIEHEVLKSHLSYLERRCLFEQIETLEEDLKEQTQQLREAQDEGDVKNVRFHKKNVNDISSDLDRLRGTKKRGEWGLGLFNFQQRDTQRLSSYKSMARSKCASCGQLDELRKKSYG